MKVSIMCSACNGEVRPGDQFCESCGAKVTAEQQDALRQRLEHSNTEMAQHMKHVRAARQAIIVLAVLFVFGGLVVGFMAFSQSQTALSNLRGLDPDMLYPEPINGKVVTVGELREMVENEPFQLVGLNVFLAALMVGLWRWAKSSVLPAILVALAVFVTVHVASALMDPKTLMQGVVIKVVAVVLLTRGVKSALAARKLEAEQRSLA